MNRNENTTEDSSMLIGGMIGDSAILLPPLLFNVSAVKPYGILKPAPTGENEEEEEEEEEEEDDVFTF